MGVPLKIGGGGEGKKGRREGERGRGRKEGRKEKRKEKEVSMVRVKMNVGSGVGVHEGTELAVGTGARPALIAQYLIALTWDSLESAKGRAVHSYLACHIFNHSFLAPGWWDLGAKALCRQSLKPFSHPPLAFLSPSCSFPAILGPTELSVLRLFPSSTTSYLWEAQEKGKPGTRFPVANLWPPSGH